MSNRETKTKEYIVAHLRSLGIDVITNIAKTGVVGLLKGDKPGPVVALRADMDALPVEERVDLPFKSKVTADYLGQTVPVMYACGHDSHVAILMGTAEVLASMKKDLKGRAGLPERRIFHSLGPKLLPSFLTLAECPNEWIRIKLPATINLIFLLTTAHWMLGVKAFCNLVFDYANLKKLSV